MSKMKTLLIIYLIIVNVAAFALYGFDKHRAKHGGQRISEKTLIVIAGIGGSLGAMAGMLFFHHNTRHGKFRYGLPVIFLIQLALVVWLLCRSM